MEAVQHPAFSAQCTIPQAKGSINPCGMTDWPSRWNSKAGHKATANSFVLPSSPGPCCTQVSTLATSRWHYRRLPHFPSCICYSLSVCPHSPAVWSEWLFRMQPDPSSPSWIPSPSHCPLDTAQVPVWPSRVTGGCLFPASPFLSSHRWHPPSCPAGDFVSAGPLPKVPFTLCSPS